jgi:hypothetical protein
MYLSKNLWTTCDIHPTLHEGHCRYSDCVDKANRHTLICMCVCIYIFILPSGLVKIMDSKVWNVSKCQKLL